MNDFRYFRIRHQTGIDYYRVDADQPEGRQVRVQDDGLWTHTRHATLTDFLADAIDNDDVAEEIAVDEVPCPLCMLVDGTVTRIVVREWSDAVAITPRPAPAVDGHVVVIPKTHVRDATASPSVAGLMAARAAELAADLGYGQWNYVQSNGRAATQTEPHAHAHIVPRHDGDGLLLPWSGAVMRQGRRFYVGPEANAEPGDVSLWRDGDHGPAPIVSRSQLDAMDRFLWPALVAVAAPTHLEGDSHA